MSYGTITIAQQVDFLYKKLGYSVAKTDNNARAASSEGNASPFLTLGTAVYQQDYLIPTYTSFGSMITGGNSTVSKVWTVQTRNNPGSVSQATWMTDKTDWIPVSLGGQGYQVGVFAGPPGLTISSLQGSSANPNGPPGTVSVPINGVNSDSWFFDYQAGILNFVDVNVPTSVSNVSNVVYITGAVYSGAKGIATFANLSVTANITTGNVLTNGLFWSNGNPIVFSGGTSSYSDSNVATFLSSFGSNSISTTGNVTSGNVNSILYGNIHTDTISPYNTTITAFNTATAIGLPVGSTAARPTPSAGYLRYNNDSLLNTIEFYNGTAWVPVTNSITDQQITPSGSTASFTLNQAATAPGVLVSINGTMQIPGVAYTVSGTTITFAETPSTTDIIDVRFIASAVATSLDYSIVDTANVTVGMSNVIVDSFNPTTYRSAKYMVSSSNGTDASMLEAQLVQNNGVTVINTSANVNTGSSYLTFYANVYNGLVNFIVKGTTSSNQLRIQRTYFNV